MNKYTAEFLSDVELKTLSYHLDLRAGEVPVETCDAAAVGYASGYKEARIDMLKGLELVIERIFPNSVELKRVYNGLYAATVESNEVEPEG
jgi:hypothetical protein